MIVNFDWLIEINVDFFIRYRVTFQKKTYVVRLISWILAIEKKKKF
jgi:hypothetical protein